ncbi:hypothetical protein D6783_02780, partial [Candidatus Woesearchaeota archaeon]
EFLMTYGWAILVVLAAIGALAYFGILSPGRFLPESCTVSGGFSCLDYQVTSSGVTLTLVNNLGEAASAVNVTFNTSAGSDVVCSDPDNSVGPLDNGQSATVTLCNTGATGLNPGNRAKGNIEITYVKSSGSLPHKATGTLNAKVQ